MDYSDEKRGLLLEQMRMARLHTRFGAALRRFFSRRVEGRPDVDDLVQDVFERLMRRGAVPQEEQIDGYVFTTANNVLTDSRRRGKVRCEALHHPFRPDEHGEADFSPEHVLANRQQLARVAAILDELPERTQAIFILRRIEGMRYGDIARYLGISISTTEKHMQRAMLHITSRMGDDDA